MNFEIIFNRANHELSIPLLVKSFFCLFPSNPKQFLDFPVTWVKPEILVHQNSDHVHWADRRLRGVRSDFWHCSGYNIFENVSVGVSRPQIIQIKCIFNLCRHPLQ
jgi:hypothetical protein